VLSHSAPSPGGGGLGLGGVGGGRGGSGGGEGGEEGGRQFHSDGGEDNIPVRREGGREGVVSSQGRLFFVFISLATSPFLIMHIRLSS